MKDNKDKPIPLQERIHGENADLEKPKIDPEDVVKGGQAGSPTYKNMNNEEKGEDENNDSK